MQYVRSLGGSVSKTWNSINPATLSGAIDVIVVEQEDGSLSCSPFHVRFGKFSLLRPYEKKVEFKVNNAKQNHSMKLGEGGEAFFVFATSEEIPESLQTSPILSPATSPQSLLTRDVVSPPTLQEPDFLDLTTNESNNPKSDATLHGRPSIPGERRAQSDYGMVALDDKEENILTKAGKLTPLSSSPNSADNQTWTGSLAHPRRAPQFKRSTSAGVLPPILQAHTGVHEPPRQLYLDGHDIEPDITTVFARSAPTDRSISPPPPPISSNEAVNRAISLSKKLSGSNIPTHVTDSGDLMLDMTGYKSSEDEALRAEVIARRILAEELEGNYDIGALIGADERGNLWIYSSEEAKEAAALNFEDQGLAIAGMNRDTASDPGYQSDEETPNSSHQTLSKHYRVQSDINPAGLAIPPETPPVNISSGGDPNRNYAKTLRLTSDQLKALSLKPGANTMSFSVNRATCQAYMWYWTHDVPTVISDIDGTITKSDALGHVLNMIGRDWTHIGVAKLYTDIVANGYNIMYLTSRSVGQADTTRAYLNGVSQEGFRLPKGPVIMSPDRTIAALRREIYLRKPEVFKMACLRDILNLFPQGRRPFYAGFGNRLTDALSYRSVHIPSTRIFTINSNAEVSLDLLTLNKYKNSYVTMREVVDHFFPPVGLLVTGGGEEFTDFNYWRDAPLDIGDFSGSDSGDGSSRENEQQSTRSEDEGSAGLDDQEEVDDLGDSYFSRDSVDQGDDLVSSMMESIEDGELEGSLFMDDNLAESPELPVDGDPVTPTEAAIEGISKGPPRLRLKGSSSPNTIPGVGDSDVE